MPQQQKRMPAYHGNEKRTMPRQQKRTTLRCCSNKRRTMPQEPKENRTTPQQQIQKPQYHSNQKETCHDAAATKTNASTLHQQKPTPQHRGNKNHAATLRQTENEPGHNNNKPGCTTAATRKRATPQQPRPRQSKRKPKRIIEQCHDDAATTPAMSWQPKRTMP